MRSTGRRRRSTRSSIASPRTRCASSSSTAGRSRRCRRGASTVADPMNDQQIDTLIAYLAQHPDRPRGLRRSARTTSRRCPSGHLPTERQDDIDTLARQAVDDGTYASYGEALFNLDLASGAYSCARCHTPGWSWGDPGVPGQGAFGWNLTGGSHQRSLPERGRHDRLRHERFGARRQVRHRRAGQRSHARLRVRCSPTSRSTPSSNTCGASDASNHSSPSTGSSSSAASSPSSSARSCGWDRST